MNRFPTKREFQSGASFSYWRYPYTTGATMYQISIWPRVYVVSGRNSSGQSVRETFPTITEARKFLRSAFRADS